MSILGAPSVGSPTPVAEAAPAVETNVEAKPAPKVAAKPDAKADPKVEKPAVKTPPEMYEVPVKGGKKKFTIDELKARASLADGAYANMEEASKIRKEAQSVLDGIQKDFIQTLVDRGLSKEQIRTRFESWYKENFIDPEQLTEEQRELQALKKEKASWDEKTKKDKESADEQAKNNEISELKKSFQQDVINTLEKNDLPKTKFMANRLVFWMRQNLDRGYDAPMEVIVQKVREERDGIVQSMVKEATPAQLVDTLGPDVVNKIRKYDLEQLEQRLGGKKEAQPSEPQDERDEYGRKRKTMSDVDRYFRELRTKKS